MKTISFRTSIVIISVVSVLAASFLVYRARKIARESEKIPVFDFSQLERKPKYEEGSKKKFIPQSFSMDTIKTKGCVADGFLSGYGENTESMVKFINSSECVYLHRALETWLSAPDFDLAEQIIEKVEKPQIVYGMFIAEALNKKSKLYYDDESRYFDFYDMCRNGTENYWGEHTCRPDLRKEEYQNYVKFIMKRAINLGIQSFLFGQVYLQDSSEAQETKMPEIVTEIRNYAKEKKVPIIIGAQTNAITEEKYLALFDYIEGGVGIDGNGSIENGPCLSRKGSCWALLWHDNFRKKAKNVLLHLDWSGIRSDDMAIFTRMTREKRAETLKNLYGYFTSRDMGFMMPVLAYLHRQNGGCYGPKKRFYAPNNKYTCKDEDTIKSIMSQRN